MGYQQSLYQDWKDGEITHGSYQYMRGDYEEQIAAANKILNHLNTEQNALQQNVDLEEPYYADFKKYANIINLKRELLIELIDHIRVYENGNISIKFKFTDPLGGIMEHIETDTEL